MKQMTWFIVIITVCLCFLTGIQGPALADGADKGRSVSVKFPAFSISPGERILGMKIKASKGSIHIGCRPSRWTCDQSDGSVHCYALHQTYALGISGMLPETIVTNLSSDGRQLSLEASVEFIDNNGKEYSKEIRESDLIIKQ
jgi:hypothetical protein